MIIVSDFRFIKVVWLYFSVVISSLFSGTFSFGIVNTESVANELAYHLYKNGKADYAYIGASNINEKEKYFNENKDNVMKKHLFKSFNEDKKPFGVTVENLSLNNSMKLFCDIAIIATYEKNRNRNTNILKNSRDAAFSRLFNGRIDSSATIDFALKKMKDAIMAKKDSPNALAFVNGYNIMLCAIYGSTDGSIGTGLDLISIEKDGTSTCKDDLKWYMENWDMVEAMKIVERQTLKIEENMSFWNKAKSKIEEKMNSLVFGIGNGDSKNTKKKFNKSKNIGQLCKQKFTPKKEQKTCAYSFWQSIKKESSVMADTIRIVLSQVGKYTKDDNTFRIDGIAIDHLGRLINILDGKCKLEVSGGSLNAKTILAYQLSELNSCEKGNAFSGVFQKVFDYNYEFLKECPPEKLITFRSESNRGAPKEISVSVEQLVQLLTLYCLVGNSFGERKKGPSVVNGQIKGSTIACFGCEYGGVDKMKKTLERWSYAKGM